IVLGHNDRAASLALELKVFTDRITLVAWDKPLNLEPERMDWLQRHGIQVYDCACAVYKCGKEGQLASIVLTDGTELELDMLFVAQRIEPNTQLAKQLSIRLDSEGY